MSAQTFVLTHFLLPEITIIQSCVKVSAVIQGLVKGGYNSTYTHEKHIDVWIINMHIS